MKSATKNKGTNRYSRVLLGCFSGSIGLSIFLTTVANANVVGADMQNFNPTTDGLDFVTVESSETLLPGFANFGLFMNYAVNTLPYFDDSNHQSRTKINDSILAADLNVGVGVARNLSIGLSLPQMVAQSVGTEGFNGEFRSNGNTEVRLNGKYRLWTDGTTGLAIGGIVNINRTKDNPYTGNPSRPIYTMQVIGDTKIAKEVALALNVGYRWRSPGEPVAEAAPIQPLPNQIIASAGASYRIESLDTKIIGEIYGSSPASSVSTYDSRASSSAEALIGVKHDIDTNLAVHGGFGTELEHGLSTPDWRIYAGVNWSMGPKFNEPQRVTIDDKPMPKEEKPFMGPPKAYERVIVHDILFEFASDSNMLGPSKETLGDLAAYLNKPPVFTKLVVIGHTDNVGSLKYNDQLSLRRAETIKKYLVETLKIDASKVQVEGKGAREPVASNGNFQGRQLNRRVEFRIYRPETNEAPKQESPKQDKQKQETADPTKQIEDKK